MKKTIALLLSAALALSLTACGTGGETPSTPAAPTGTDSLPSAPAGTDAPASAPAAGTEAPAVTIPQGTEIVLSDGEITVDGQPAGEDSTASVYTAHDIVYYESGHDFTYGEGTEADEHSRAEADPHTVVHITRPGTYVLSGSLSAGQIAVDLGEDAEDDPEAVVNLVLDGADITCTVAPAIIFYNVYECGDKDDPRAEVDTSAAGANVFLADGSENRVKGSYVARIYKSVELNEEGTEVVDSKKLHKYDGALYSKMSMNVAGNDGVLHIDAENEGLDSELHLTILGGVIDIVSGNDGINTNGDGVSVTTVNGGELTVTVNGSTGEGDGIDSNGWLVINGGTVRAYACATSGDAGIDSDMGILLNGGTVVATGNMLDAIDGASGQNYVIFNLQNSGQGTEYTLKDADGNDLMAVPTANGFSILLVSCPQLPEGLCALYDGGTLAASAQPGAAGQGGMGGHGGFPGGMGGPGGQRPDGERPQRPDGEGQTPPELPEGQTPPEMPDGQTPPEGGFGPGGQRPPDGEETPAGPDAL